MLSRRSAKSVQAGTPTNFTVFKGVREFQEQGECILEDTALYPKSYLAVVPPMLRTVWEVRAGMRIRARLSSALTRGRR